MRLNESRVEAVAAVSDLAAAREFYERQLGLPPGIEEDGGIRYAFAHGTALFVYVSPENAGSTRATVAGVFVEDLDQTIDELATRGVTFDQYDQPGIKTDDRGVFDNGRIRAAWVKDPDGNTLALTEVHPSPTADPRGEASP
jgi:catechol 2,3-dioxygenase-like lactoylglutathione lyase family enzyme